MPVFVCEACNETLKRAKVQAHAASCRGCWVMSCMDCNRKFEGDDYWEHTSCVTEAERYQGHLYVHKDNKGDVKQQAWLSNVQAKLDCAPSSERLKPFLSALLKYDNIPRKKPKFLNFAKNSLNLKADREGIAAQLWDVIGFDSAPKEAAANGGSPHLEKSAETHKQTNVEQPAKPATAKREGLKGERQQPSSEEPPGRASDAKPQGRKRKVELQEGEEKPIKWKKIIAKELKSCGGRMNLKELRKACVAEALAHPSHRNRQGGQVRREFDEQLSTFHKFKVDGNQVTLQATNED